MAALQFMIKVIDGEGIKGDSEIQQKIRDLNEELGAVLDRE